MSGKKRADAAGSILAVAVTVLLTASTSTAKYSGGTGEPNNPYRIETPNDLNDIGNHVEDFNKCFVMVNDVNLAAYTGTQFNVIGGWLTGESPCPMQAFTGVFDGNGFEISNFSYSSAGNPNCPGFAGIFGWVDDANAAIINLGMRGVSVHDPWLMSPTPITGAGVGSLIGTLGNGTVRGCYVEGCSVSGGFEAGGLVGYNSGTIANCHAAGQVSAVSSGGGLVGENGDGLISGCYATGSVSAGYDAGGLVGRNRGLICNCHARGAADSNEDAGGLVGHNDGIVSKGYAAGLVDANTYEGGLVGFHGGGSYLSCFWDSDVNPDVNGIGNANEPSVVGKPTAEMMTESTFTNAGWNFVEVWDIGENQTYPFLRVHPAGDINHDYRVNFLDLAILADHWLEGAAP
jgi:hypothetical protein